MEGSEDIEGAKGSSIIADIYTKGKLARKQKKHEKQVDQAKFGTRKEQKSATRKVTAAWERNQTGVATSEDLALLTQYPHIVSSIEAGQRVFEAHLPEDQLEKATSRLRQGLRIPEVQGYVSATYPKVHGEVPDEIRELVKPMTPQEPQANKK